MALPQHDLWEIYVNPRKMVFKDIIPSVNLYSGVNNTRNFVNMNNMIMIYEQ